MHTPPLVAIVVLIAKDAAFSGEEPSIHSYVVDNASVDQDVILAKIAAQLTLDAQDAQDEYDDLPLPDCFTALPPLPGEEDGPLEPVTVASIYEGYDVHFTIQLPGA